MLEGKVELSKLRKDVRNAVSVVRNLMWGYI
jgi:hypothetical protein